MLVAARLDDFDLRQVGAADRLAQRSQAIVAQLRREHPSAGADVARQDTRQRAVAGADFGDDGAGREPERLDEAIDVAGFALRTCQAVPGQQGRQQRDRAAEATERVAAWDRF